VSGVEEGWFPTIAAPNVPSKSLYGSCESILDRTKETEEIIHPYPWIDREYWRGAMINETDLIVPKNHTTPSIENKNDGGFHVFAHDEHFSEHGHLFLMIGIVTFLLWSCHKCLMPTKNNRSKYHGYTEIQT
jgi:hypothetical protein